MIDTPHSSPYSSHQWNVAVSGFPPRSRTVAQHVLNQVPGHVLLDPQEQHRRVDYFDPHFFRRVTFIVLIYPSVIRGRTSNRST